MLVALHFSANFCSTLLFGSLLDQVNIKEPNWTAAKEKEGYKGYFIAIVFQKDVLTLPPYHSAKHPLAHPWRALRRAS